MIRAKQEHVGPIVVDLTGPDGNAFALMGLATRLAKQLDIDSHTIKVITTKNSIKIFGNPKLEINKKIIIQKLKR